MAETPAKIAVAVTVPKDPLLEAFETQQQAVTADSGDFNKWVSLISAADKLVRLTPRCINPVSSCSWTMIRSLIPLEGMCVLGHVLYS